MAVKHPNWPCPGCGEVMYYVGACHHAHGCDGHHGCENYQEAIYRASGMWQVNWSRERVQRASGKTPEGGKHPIAFFETIMVKSYETLVDSDTKVDVNTGIVAAGRLRSLIDSRDYD